MKKAGFQNVPTGLYIGAKYVYVAQVKKTLFGLQLAKLGQKEIQVSVPQPPGGVESAEFVKAQNQAKVEAIKNVLRENNITSQNVFTALPGKDVLIRYFQMPKIPKAEWKTAIKFEAKKYIPFKMEDLMWDFQIVSPKRKDAKMDVTFVAVKKELAQNHLALLTRAGLKPVALEPAPFSLVRLFVLGKQLAKNKPTAIIDVDYGIADINILKDKICYLTRDVSLPLEEETIFEHLLNELRMSLDYYEKLFLTEVIGKILLCGEVELKDWDKTLAQELKVPVEKVSLEKVVKFRGPTPPLSSTVAIGLALRSFTKAVTGVNLYEVSEAKAKPLAAKELFTFTPEIRRAAFIATGISCASLLLLHLAMFRQVAQERKELKEVIALRPEINLSMDLSSYADMKAARERIEEQLTVLDKVINQRIFLTAKFNELSAAIPENAWLTDLTFSDDLSRDNKIKRSLTIKGVAYHQDPGQVIGIITKLVSKLKDNRDFSQGFTEVKLDSMASTKVGELPAKRFVIICTR